MSEQHKRLILIPLVFLPFLLEAQVESWTVLAPTGTLPGPRDNAYAVYSSASNRLVAFGGYPQFTTETNVLWILQDANGLGTPAWTLAIPAGAPGSPQPRNGAAMVYDSLNNPAMLVGGLPLSNRVLNDLWVLTNADGTTGAPYTLCKDLGTRETFWKN